MSKWILWIEFLYLVLSVPYSFCFVKMSPFYFSLFSEVEFFFLWYFSLKEIKVLWTETSHLLFRAIRTFIGGDALCSDPFLYPKKHLVTIV